PIGLALFKTLCSRSLRHAVRLCGCIMLLIAGTPLLFAAPKPALIIVGGEASLRENVRHFLPLADESCQTPRWRLRSLMRSAQADIARAGQALGYYPLAVDSNLEVTADCWMLTIPLVPGERVRISDVRIEIHGEGSQDPVFQAIQNDPGIHRGDRLNHGRYDALKNRFGNLAAERGYFGGYFDLARVG